MFTIIPLPVHHYLDNLLHKGRFIGYCQLDQAGFLIRKGGNFNNFCSEKLYKSMPVDEQLNFLFGYLPVSDEAVVVPSIHYLENQYFDLHIYASDGSQWLVFIETSIEANKRRELQQTHLSNQLKMQSLKVSFLREIFISGDTVVRYIQKCNGFGPLKRALCVRI